MEYRHELKFLVSALDADKIKYRLEPLMKKDSHQKGNYYTVRSLYFDDIYDSCLKEIEAGCDNRKKFRIRLYNGNIAWIHLEKKSKFRGMTKKEQEAISIETCQKYMRSEEVWGEESIAQELYAYICIYGMHPACIVEYERTVFMEACGNVRITLDRNIRGTGKTENFLSPVLDSYVLAQKPEEYILEVKYDEFLPVYILQAVDLNHLQRQAVSKYAYVRYAINTKGNGRL